MAERRWGHNWDPARAGGEDVQGRPRGPRHRPWADGISMAAAAPGLRPPPSCGLRQARARATGRRWGLERPTRAPDGERCARLPRTRLEGPERPPLRPSPQENRGH